MGSAETVYPGRGIPPVVLRVRYTSLLARCTGLWSCIGTAAGSRDEPLMTSRVSPVCSSSAVPCAAAVTSPRSVLLSGLVSVAGLSFCLFMAKPHQSGPRAAPPRARAIGPGPAALSALLARWCRAGRLSSSFYSAERMLDVLDGSRSGGRLPGSRDGQLPVPHPIYPFGVISETGS